MYENEAFKRYIYKDTTNYLVRQNKCSEKFGTQEGLTQGDVLSIYSWMRISNRARKI